MRSLSKHVNDIVSDNRIINNDIIGFAETQSAFTCKLIESPNFFNIHFNNNQNEFLSLAYGCRNEVVVVHIFDANGASIFCFKKHAFVDRVFILMLVYRKQSLGVQQFSQTMQYLLAVYSVDI